MKSLYLLFFLTIQAFFSFAQNVTVGPSAKPLLKSMAKTPVEGSVYFNNKYANGKIKTLSEKEFNVKDLRYNLETQQLEYTENDNIYAIQDSVQSFTLIDSLGKSHQFTKMGKAQSNNFYEIVADGKVALLKQYTVKKEVTEDWYTKKKVNKMVQQNIYFTNQGGLIQKFTPSEKNTATVLGDKKNEITAFIKNEQLNLREDDDLAKVFIFYNTLH
ncbi:hypothetical protein [Pedobacter roseus]|uniref:Uncharacterized protein n=1 Tax=Pedobacter roseus TaxID=336820 RepID=A0A7G9QE43_9SPHI|nr:hypothetical protein [Pedobacter roseus]QNN41618.1 hypothetical protein H9L23_21325 [Pedobacter roseus]